MRIHAFWSGVITFGLVSVPVNLFPGTRSRDVSMRMMAPDGNPISRRYYCPREDRPIDRSEIIRGYEIEDGEFVLVTDDELEALEPERSREIDLRRFVPVEQIDPVFFERPYFLTPAAETNKAYRLLAAAMEESGRAGIATFVMRGKEYLIAILAERGILRAETLRFHDEIRAPEHIELPEQEEPAATGVQRFKKRIAARTEKALAEEELRDVYAAQLRELVERKLESREDVVRPTELPEDEDAEVIDLMEVLKRSLRQSADADDGRGDQAPGAREPDLRDRTKAELYEQARSLDIQGRSQMTKEELIEAIQRAS